MASYISVNIVNDDASIAGLRLIPIDNITTIISTSTTVTTINYSSNMVGVGTRVIETYDGGDSGELNSVAITHDATTQPVFVGLVVDTISDAINYPLALRSIDTSTYAVSEINFTLS